MGVTRINPDGEIEYPFGKPERKEQGPDLNEIYRKEIERNRQKMPNADIAERTPEDVERKKKPSLPKPWVIEGAFEEIKKREKEEQQEKKEPSA